MRTGLVSMTVRLCLALSLLFWGNGAFAAPVEIKLKYGIIATADYRSGRADKPVVILVHGFMQTRHSPPMNRLADALADSGYAVLIPTLSLGISRRVRSLPCEAAHRHTLQDEANELGHWVDWLAGQNKPQKIAIIGHSTGSQAVLAYLAGTPGNTVKKGILTSLGPIFVDDPEFEKVRKSPEMRTETGLKKFTLAYCRKNYVSTPSAYLSYAERREDRLLNEVGAIKAPVDMIIGGKDQLYSPGWAKRVRASKLKVAVIEDAGHFYDGEHEFDLFDRVQEMLADLPR
ncbi:MAG: alpha/beta fold hydrolase [Sulfuricellaceae bacterium]|nr:alpha/beta fold hydrolase [Sulfuricellaceae bacterium]